MKSGDVIAICDQLHRVVKLGGRTGVRLVNSGLGPAIVTQSMVHLDGARVGSWDSAVATEPQAELALRF